MTIVCGEIHINATKETVWKVLADLGAVCTWNPTITNSYYISEAKQGVGASRHCDFPNGGFVKEIATQWDAPHLVRLHVYEGTVPFDNYYGTYSLADDGDESRVRFVMDYKIQPDSTLSSESVERQNRERFIPTILDGLKNFIEKSPRVSSSGE